MAASNLNAEEEKLLNTFTEKVNAYRQHEHQPPLPRNTAIKFLMARKFDYHRAVELYLSHEDMRAKEGLTETDFNDLNLQKELSTGKFTVLSGRDSHGAGIALFTAKCHQPSDTTHQVVLKALIYLLDAALESRETQRHGIVFIYDMSESKYGNFDYDLSIKILNMLKGAYPARLKKVLIVTAPLWFKAPFKILRLFVREKLRDRVFTVNQEQLLQHIPRDSLPQKFGGNLSVNHRHWLQVCAQIHQSNSDVIDSYFVSRKQSVSHSSSENSDFVHLNDGGLESEDSKETVSEKQSNEEGEKDDLIDINGIEKEVNVEKEGGRGKSKRRHESDNAHNSSRVSSKGSRDFSESRQMDTNMEDIPPPNPCKKRPTSHGSNIWEDSVHMAEEGGMTVADLVRHVKEKGKKGLHDEYAEIRREPPAGTFHLSKAKYNLPKNRYSDVLCFDHSRVTLPQTDGDPSADYINANFVDGYMQKRAYISTQGPFSKTFGDFWRMVWMSQSVTIVMTTKTMEKGRVKCGQYWPLEEDGEEQSDEFIVTNMGMEHNRDYTITSLSLHNTNTGQVRQVKHLQFTSWPDYGIPPAAGFLDFLLRVRACQADSMRLLEPAWNGHPNGPPMVVHCSAGIGRTGTFICTDISLHRLEHIHTINIRETVRRIRSQRAFSIQMPDQYVFCHLAIIDYAIKHEMLPDTDWVSLDDSDSDGFD
ncbi:tyrosine-protein phosphatase non-receptor type 9-like [Mercenaria mercenaria]|uniref:tyrosine-protein phosphatase non-receptor type 9-like n=1 Tax=Mercenaria mercenaria TaxID=6596 RepID=UPI00234E6FB3|nr:tyrosine-protein phosphatase non-receptor type 9-like [Mercenaria mercenaria]